MPRIVLVSNRVTDLASAIQAGGVSVALAEVVKSQRALWFGWNGQTVDHLTGDSVAKSKVGSDSLLATTSLTTQEHKNYYLGFANSVLWPTFHNRLDLARFSQSFHPGYGAVNRRFSRLLARMLEPDDIIWVHDYHLIPMAQELRAIGVTSPIGFFLHIPAPPPQTFIAIPEHQTISRNLSAYDLIGVQTHSDAANLLGIFQHTARGDIISNAKIRAFDRLISVSSFPVGIDVNTFSGGSKDTKLAQSPSEAKRIIGIDRLDYTKGLPQKFLAFEQFLASHECYRGKVVLTQIAPPTREDVEAYSEIRRTLEQLAGSINGRFGDLDWVPIHYIHRTLARERLRDIYRSSDICMVTPLQDGMNLVAKEFVAAQDPQDPGVVILSRFAGAAEQMPEALIVNPHDIDEVADAIRFGLEMSKQERVRRHAALYEKVASQNTFSWCQSFLTELLACSNRHSAPSMFGLEH